MVVKKGVLFLKRKGGYQQGGADTPFRTMIWNCSFRKDWSSLVSDIKQISILLVINSFTSVILFFKKFEFRWPIAMFFRFLSTYFCAEWKALAFWFTSEMVAVLIHLLLFGLLDLSFIFPSKVSLEILKCENIFIDVSLFAVYCPCRFACIIYLNLNKNYSLNEQYHGHLNVNVWIVNKR